MGPIFAWYFLHVAFCSVVRRGQLLRDAQIAWYLARVALCLSSLRWQR